MTFWDSSAVVALLIVEDRTPTADALYGEDPELALWWATRTECISAMMRNSREGGLMPTDEQRARLLLADLVDRSFEIAPAEAIRDRAERLLAVHPLRAADAFQLAAALVWTHERPTDRRFATFDRRLGDAASREGFSIVPAQTV